MNKDKKSKIKRLFRLFFEGAGDPLEPYDMLIGPEIDIPIMKFGITNMEFFQFDEGIAFRITLERPGLLIGKAGRVIDAIQKYLSDELEESVKIYIVESKLWE